ncbi:MAG: GntR family transcriptional regulator [Rhodospirillales bacterium]|nr:GntR family transcriptional regulator [Rhodospirillales bacterium]
MHPTLATADRLARTLPPGQRPTRLHVHILAKLLHWRSATPTHRGLARAAGCSRRTVLRALARLSALGLLSWQPRVVCGRGWAVRIANAYSFGAAPRAESIRIQCCAELSHPPAAPSLAAVRQAREARFAAAWAVRRRV